MEERIKAVPEAADFDEKSSGGPDLYQMYLDDLQKVPPCTPEEEASLLEDILTGNVKARERLVEGNLYKALSIAEEYRDRGISMGDLAQEANVALLMLAAGYEGGDFNTQMEEKIREAIDLALESQTTEMKVEEEMAARVNVLKDISASMAEELGREASVEELAERMKMTEDEIKDIMKLTINAMSVTGE